MTPVARTSLTCERCDRLSMNNELQRIVPYELNITITLSDARECANKFGRKTGCFLRAA